VNITKKKARKNQKKNKSFQHFPTGNSQYSFLYKSSYDLLNCPTIKQKIKSSTAVLKFKISLFSLINANISNSLFFCSTQITLTDKLINISQTQKNTYSSILSTENNSWNWEAKAINIFLLNCHHWFLLTLTWNKIYRMFIIQNDKNTRNIFYFLIIFQL
jgi:hypothetical protein